MATFKNIDKGPRGLNTTKGKVWLEPGETVEVDLAEGEDAPENWFESSGLPEKGDGKPSERDELKKQADELGLQYAGNISNVKLKELIDAKLAE